MIGFSKLPVTVSQLTPHFVPRTHVTRTELRAMSDTERKEFIAWKKAYNAAVAKFDKDTTYGINQAHKRGSLA
jgi:hypothetical protein